MSTEVTKKIKKHKSQKNSQITAKEDRPQSKRAELNFEFMEAEKLVVQDPNNSDHWVNYVALLAEKDGIDKARKEVNRALLVINFSRESDMLNIWKTYLNLEYYFGDAEKLLEVTRNALAANKKEDVLCHVIDLYVQDNKFDSAEEFLKLLLKKGENKINSWLKYIEFTNKWRHYTKTADEENDESQDEEAELPDFDNKIKELVRRALQSLQKKDHIFFLTKYSVMEYKFGNFNVARTNFENILGLFPKRNDLW